MSDAQAQGVPRSRWRSSAVALAALVTLAAVAASSFGWPRQQGQDEEPQQEHNGRPSSAAPCEAAPPALEAPPLAPVFLPPAGDAAELSPEDAATAEAVAAVAWLRRTAAEEAARRHRQRRTTAATATSDLRATDDGRCDALPGDAPLATPEPPIPGGGDLSDGAAIAAMDAVDSDADDSPRGRESVAERFERRSRWLLPGFAPPLRRARCVPLAPGDRGQFWHHQTTRLPSHAAGPAAAGPAKGAGVSAHLANVCFSSTGGGLSGFGGSDVATAVRRVFRVAAAGGPAASLGTPAEDVISVFPRVTAPRCLFDTPVVVHAVAGLASERRRRGGNGGSAAAGASAGIDAAVLGRLLATDALADAAVAALALRRAAAGEAPSTRSSTDAAVVAFYVLPSAGPLLLRRAANATTATAATTATPNATSAGEADAVPGALLSAYRRLHGAFGRRWFSVAAPEAALPADAEAALAGDTEGDDVCFRDVFVGAPGAAVAAFADAAPARSPENEVTAATEGTAEAGVAATPSLRALRQRFSRCFFSPSLDAASAARTAGAAAVAFLAGGPAGSGRRGLPPAAAAALAAGVGAALAPRLSGVSGVVVDGARLAPGGLARAAAPVAAVVGLSGSASLLWAALALPPRAVVVELRALAPSAAAAAKGGLSAEGLADLAAALGLAHRIVPVAALAALAAPQGAAVSSDDEAAVFRAVAAGLCRAWPDKPSPCVAGGE